MQNFTSKLLKAVYHQIPPIK